MKYLEAPEYKQFSSRELDESIFLAGSITGAENWQERAAYWLSKSYHVFNPRRENFNTEDSSQLPIQIRWEHSYIASAKNILFWFSHETLAPITLFELGKVLGRGGHKGIFIGTDPQYKRRDDVIEQVRLERPDLEVYSSLIATVAEADLHWTRGFQPTRKTRDEIMHRDLMRRNKLD